jgi:hypothetical protein
LNGSKLDGRYLDVIAAKGPTKIESKFFGYPKAWKLNLTP